MGDSDTAAIAARADGATFLVCSSIPDAETSTLRTECGHDLYGATAMCFTARVCSSLSPICGPTGLVNQYWQLSPLLLRPQKRIGSSVAEVDSPLAYTELIKWLQTYINCYV